MLRAYTEFIPVLALLYRQLSLSIEDKASLWFLDLVTTSLVLLVAYLITKNFEIARVARFFE